MSSPRQRAPLFAVLAAFVCSACQSDAPIIVFGALPEGTETIVVALEQGPKRAVFAHPIAEGGLEIEAPELDGGPISIARLAFRDPIAQFGLSRSAPLPAALVRSRPLSSFLPLAIETATVTEDSTQLSFTAGAAPSWLLTWPIWRPDTCLLAAESEVALDDGAPRGTISLGPGVAAGVSDTVVAFFRTEEAPLVVSLRPEERGRGAAMGGDGRWWALTSSRAVALAPDASRIIAEHWLPAELEPIGMTEDPSSGDLYYFSIDADLWRQSANSTVAERLYTVPADRVRRAGLGDAIARFYFVADQTLLVVVPEVNAVIEVKADRVRLVSEIVPDAGFISFQHHATGEVLLAEKDSSRLYRYVDGMLEPIGQANSQVNALSSVFGADRQLLFASTRGSLGTIDLTYPDPCPELWLPSGALVEDLAVAGDRYLAFARRKPQRGEFHWLRMSL